MNLLNRKLILSFLILYFFNGFSHIFAFSIKEKSVSEIHKALKENITTCEEIITQTLDDIYHIDSPQNDLNIFLSLNPHALEKARKLDQKSKNSKELKKLHCIPIALKDNINTSFLPTTGGALADSRPDYNAFIVEKILSEDAIIIGKTNLHEYALSFKGFSLLGGQTRNVYNTQRGPGGSSSGTASAVAASLATIGIGTDTGGSIRIPSSNQSLIGLRPSLRLISQHGIMPLSPFQDTAGPICRVASDCALMMQILAQYDSSNMSNHRAQFDIQSSLMKSERDYLQHFKIDQFDSLLDDHALKGAKIAVVPLLFGDNPNVIKLAQAAIANFTKAGAQVTQIKIPHLRKMLTEYNSISALEFSSALTRYLQTWDSTQDKHPRSFDEIYNASLFSTVSQTTMDFYFQYGQAPQSHPEYIKNTVERPQFIRPILKKLFTEYDVLIYPTITGLPGILGESPTSSGPANKLSPFSGHPAITMPIGYASDEINQVIYHDLPVGLELMADEFQEMKLLQYVHSYQKQFSPRKSPDFLHL